MTARAVSSAGVLTQAPQGARVERSASREAGPNVTVRIVIDRLKKAVELTNALASDLTSDALASHNGQAPSNTIGAQFWCVVGARESYVRAYQSGAWQGFTCSLRGAEIGDPQAVRAALARSQELVHRSVDARGADPQDGRVNVLIDLAEHEVQHHGQLIRFFYANDLPFPEAFAKRYSL